MDGSNQDERVRQKRRIEVDEEEEEESIIPPSGVASDPMLAMPLIGAPDSNEDEDDEGSNPDDQQAEDDEDEGVDGEDLLDTYEA